MEKSNVLNKPDDYKVLKGRLRKQNSFQKASHLAVFNLVFVLTLLSIGMIALFNLESLSFTLLNALFLAFVFTQIGFIVHDAGHHQLFEHKPSNKVIGYIVGNFLFGMSFSWWVKKHNRHHASPNHEVLDPDFNLRFLAFSHRQAQSKHRQLAPLIRNQAYLFFPLLCLQAFSMRISSIIYLLKNESRHSIIEAILILSGLAAYLGTLIYALGLHQGLLFALLHQALFGLYMGLVFAPNHIGMPVFNQGGSEHFLRKQVLTARNIKPNKIADYLYGGLNYQIEHHLFPSMPRRNYLKARKIVKQYCAAHLIPYCEQDILQAYRSVFNTLFRVQKEFKAYTTD